MPKTTQALVCLSCTSYHLAYQKSALSPAFGEKELPAKNIFNLADLTIYLRWLITTRQEGHELQHFFTKSKVMIDLIFSLFF